jgi:hypothetical protein
LTLSFRPARLHGIDAGGALLGFCPGLLSGHGQGDDR